MTQQQSFQQLEGRRTSATQVTLHEEEEQLVDKKVDISTSSNVAPNPNRLAVKRAEFTGMMKHDVGRRHRQQNFMSIPIKQCRKRPQANRSLEQIRVMDIDVNSYDVRESVEDAETRFSGHGKIKENSNSVVAPGGNVRMSMDDKFGQLG